MQLQPMSTGSTSNHPAMVHKRKNDNDTTNTDNSSLSSTSLSVGTNTFRSHRSTTTSSSSTVAAVIYSPRNNYYGNSTSTTSGPTMSWTQCKGRLHTLLRQYNENDIHNSNAYNNRDAVLDDIATISTTTTQSKMKNGTFNGSSSTGDRSCQRGYDQQHETQVQQADDILSMIQSDIHQIQQQVQTVSTKVGSLQEQYDTAQQYHRTMEEEMTLVLRPKYEQYMKLRHNTHLQIQRYENDIKNAQQTTIQLVPRLQQQISLYVTMTGIKWLYNNNNNNDHCTTTATTTNDSDNDQLILSGEINIPSKQMIRRFDIRQEKNNIHMEYELARQLWNMIDGYNIIENDTNIIK